MLAAHRCHYHLQSVVRRAEAASSHEFPTETISVIRQHWGNLLVLFPTLLPSQDSTRCLPHVPRSALSTSLGFSVWMFSGCSWLAICRRVHIWKGRTAAYQNKRDFTRCCLQAITQGHQHRKRCQRYGKRQIKTWHQRGRLCSMPHNSFSCRVASIA